MMTKDFEVHPSGTRKVLDAKQMRIERAKESLRLIMDAYPASTMAHQTAKKALDSLTDES